MRGRTIVNQDDKRQSAGFVADGEGQQSGKWSSHHGPDIRPQRLGATVAGSIFS